jgi:spore cortex formation protein SpoVR/YcgB (stage V sporulation)
MTSALVHAGQPISRGGAWTFDLIEQYDAAIRSIAVGEFGLDCYTNQIEVISSEQMLDGYASGGLPIGYPHWTYGKAFIRSEQSYRSGASGLAYEIVINSDPCIAYLMEQNSMPLQALVIAHACYGHNSFFKGNYLFRQWTSADAIIDYMVFARKYVMDCEERYGIGAVEEMLDSCHALRDFGVSRYQHPEPLSIEAERVRARSREDYAWTRHDDIWRTLPVKAEGKPAGAAASLPTEPQENLLYFIEKHSPKLLPWQRELVRIVRKVAQYFYPQGQTKLMNEGWATFWHYTILNRLYDKGLVDDGFMLEFLQSHTNVIAQPGFDHPRYGGINPYALGFAMFTDIRRICEHPTAEDREWFPDIAGGDWRQTLDGAMRNYKDESFIGQFLSPRLMREFHLFAISDYEAESTLGVDAIHNERGYRRVRQRLAQQYNRDVLLPNIQVTQFARDGDRSLTVRHTVHRKCLLSDDSAEVARHLARLWGFRLRLETVEDSGTVLQTRDFQPA